MEQNALINFDRGLTNEHSCKICRRSRLKVFLFLALAAILFNGAEGFEQFW